MSLGGGSGLRSSADSHPGALGNSVREGATRYGLRGPEHRKLGKAAVMGTCLQDGPRRGTLDPGIRVVGSATVQSTGDGLRCGEQLWGAEEN